MYVSKQVYEKIVGLGPGRYAEIGGLYFCEINTDIGDYLLVSTRPEYCDYVARNGKALGLLAWKAAKVNKYEFKLYLQPFTDAKRLASVAAAANAFLAKNAGKSPWAKARPTFIDATRLCPAPAHRYAPAIVWDKMIIIPGYSEVCRKHDYDYHEVVLCYNDLSSHRKLVKAQRVIAPCSRAAMSLTTGGQWVTRLAVYPAGEGHLYMACIRDSDYGILFVDEKGLEKILKRTLTYTTKEERREILALFRALSDMLS